MEAGRQGSWEGEKLEVRSEKLGGTEIKKLRRWEDERLGRQKIKTYRPGIFWILAFYLRSWSLT